MVKQRVFTPDSKAQVVLEELSGVKDRAALCREHRLSPQVLRRWQEEFVARAC
jgi:transposase-like protein